MMGINNLDEQRRQGGAAEPSKPVKAALGAGGALAALGLFLKAGLSIGVALLAGVLGGIWLDRRLGTAPWLLLAGCLAGLAVSFRTLFGMASAKKREVK